MECVANIDMPALKPGDLPLSKRKPLLITDWQQGEERCFARDENNRCGFILKWLITESFIDMKTPRIFPIALSNYEVDMILHHHYAETGYFFIPTCTLNPGTFVLIVKDGDAITPFVIKNNDVCFELKGRKFESVDKLVNYFKYHALKRRYTSNALYLRDTPPVGYVTKVTKPNIKVEDDDLSVKCGESVIVLEVLDPTFYVGIKKSNFQRGYIPKTHVKLDNSTRRVFIPLHLIEQKRREKEEEQRQLQEKNQAHRYEPTEDEKEFERQQQQHQYNRRLELQMMQQVHESRMLLLSQLEEDEEEEDDTPCPIFL